MPTTGDKKRAQVAEAMRRKRESEREIGEPEFPDDGPPLPTAAEFEEGRNSLAFFAKTCFPRDFPLEWSVAHLTAIQKLEQACLHGGTFALAMPRGSGKTTIARAAAMWAVLFGHRRFVCVIGSEASFAAEMVEAIKTDLEANDHLLAWFPDVCWPIRNLEGVSTRATYQKFRGRKTFIGWAGDDLKLPHLPDNPASEAVITARGILGKIRGQFSKSREGSTMRPDMVIIDDPQTDESASSPAQCDKRERIMKRAILPLAGPNTKIAGVMLCTVLRQDDFADRMLSHEQNPEWQGQRTQMLPQMPERIDLWEGAYDDERRRGIHEGVGLKFANEFYAAHRGELDAGAIVSWESRKQPDEVSAIQSAMNMYLKDRAAFLAEMQQTPDAEGTTQPITEALVMKKVNDLDLGICPTDTEKVTAFIDVQETLLYWCAVAWTGGFGGQVLGYGPWPAQPDPYFTLVNARVKLGDLYDGGPDAQLKQGLTELTGLLERRWKIVTGGSATTNLIQIDAGYKSRIVREVIREQAGRHLLHGYGKGVTARMNAINHNYSRKAGERLGPDWRLVWTKDLPRQKHVIYDANTWKSFIADRLNTEDGDRGSLAIHAGDVRYHRMFAEHLTAEGAIRTKNLASFREADEWTLRPGRADNHLFDCLVGAAVAASVEGVKLDEDLPSSKPRRLVFKQRKRG